MSFGFTARGRFPLSEFDDLDALTSATHDSLDTLVHNLSEDVYQAFTYVGGKLTNTTSWTDSGMTLKIREADFTYSGNSLATSVKKQYNGAGAVIQTLSGTYTYSGGKLTSIDIVRT